MGWTSEESVMLLTNESFDTSLGQMILQELHRKEMLLLVGVAWMNFIKERRLEKGITRGDLQNRDYMN